MPQNAQAALAAKAKEVAEREGELKKREEGVDAKEGKTVEHSARAKAQDKVRGQEQGRGQGGGHGAGTQGS